MKISGIISEFNPFHNGHKYLINKAKEETDAVVCVMSGSFVQRGEVAVFDKWTRAKAALMNGADLVIELPVVYSVSTAERFAFGSTELLASTGCIDEIIFGSESGDIDLLYSSAKTIFNEPDEVSVLMKKYLDDGMGFPAAREKAYENYIPENILNNPNNILGIEYIISSLKNNLNLNFRTIKRFGCDYHSVDNNSEFASATAIRNSIFNKENYTHAIPENIIDIYINADIYKTDILNDVIIYLLRISSSEHLRNLNDVTEGLENRLKHYADKYDNIQDILSQTVTKRYTKTKIMRILISLLLQIDKEIIYSKNSYIRILGFTDKGREIIKTMKKTSSLPVITKTADYKENDDKFNIDIKSTDIASLCSNNKSRRISGKDFLNSPIYVKI